MAGEAVRSVWPQDYRTIRAIQLTLGLGMLRAWFNGPVADPVPPTRADPPTVAKFVADVVGSDIGRIFFAGVVATVVGSLGFLVYVLIFG